MAVALPALWLAALMIAFYLAAQIILTPLIIGVLRRTPLIGGLLVNAAEGIVNTVESAISRWVSPHLTTIIKWLKAAAIATISPAAALVYFGAKVEEALAHLVGTKLLSMIHAVTNPIVRVVNATARAEQALASRFESLEIRVGRAIEQGLRDLSTELLAKFRAGIDTLRRDVFSEAIPGLEKEIISIARGAEAEIAGVGKDVAGVAARLADLVKRLDIPLSMLEAIVASIGVVAALEALETLATCRGKLRSLCRTDPGVWDDFLLGALALVAFPGFREMARMGVALAEDARDAIKELVES